MYIYYKLFICVLISILSGCTLHYYKMNGKPIHTENSTPWKEKAKVNFSRVVILGEEKLIAKSYNSEDVIQHVRDSCCLHIDKNSPYQVKYSTQVKDNLENPLGVILWMLTLGFFPVIEKVDADVSVKVLDNSDTVLKEYRYKIEEMAYNSWLTIPISILMFSDDSFAHSYIHSFSYPQKFIIHRFENDFIQDLVTGNLKDGSIPNNFTNNSTESKPSKATTIEKPATEKKEAFNSNYKIAILPIKYNYPKDSNIAEAIRDKVETLMVNKGYTVIERMKLDEILKEMKLSQAGLTTSEQIKIGNMLNATNLLIGEILELNSNDSFLEFSIRSIDVNSGKILWKYELSVDERNIAESLNKSMFILDSKISGN